MIDLSGQVALVTGGSRGVGAATVRLLAQAGAAVAFTFRERTDAANALVSEIGKSGAKAVAIHADVSHDDSNRQVIAQTKASFGRLDMLILNAGIWPDQDVPVESMDNTRWRRTLGVNLDGVFYGVRAGAAAMEDGGRIVVVSSTAGQRGEAFHADYAATKGAVNAFVKSLAIELAPKITVNAVAPGWIDTEMSKRPYEQDGGVGKVKIAENIPLGRIATAEDIAGPILFLCSSLARHVTGEIMNVNGGAVLCG